MENSLVILNQFRRKYTINWFNFIHGILKVKSIPSVICKVNFFGEKPIDYICSIWIVEIDLFLFFVLNRYFATFEHEIFLCVFFNSTLGIFFIFNFHLFILRLQINSEILEAFWDGVTYVTIKSMLVDKMFGFNHFLFESINELLNKISFTHKVEMFHRLEMIFEIVPLFEFWNKFWT